MYELIQVGENTFYIDCPAKIGVYRISDSEAILIDSGSDKDAAKKVLKHFDANGWNLSLVINTHSHADHIGGNHLLQQRTGCTISGPAIEGCTVRYPILEPAILYGGYPFEELRNKFLMAQPTEIFTPLEDVALPAGMEIVDLPGHAMAMIGVKTPDDIWFLADCVSSSNILSKYHVGFIYDVAAYLKTLDVVEHLSGKLFVPAHTPTVENMKKLVEINRNKVEEIRDLLLSICGEPTSFEDILQHIFLHYDLVMDFNQNVLVGSAIRSYLSWMKDEEMMVCSISDNKLLWMTV